MHKLAVLELEMQIMANKISMALIFSCVYLHIFLAQGESPLVPALYVFGDSLSDTGNNNYLQTRIKVNYTPYGVDFPSGPTGRFSNGKIFIDFITQQLGLPFVPPYLGLSEAERSTTKTGVNYASGSAGILPESGTAFGDNLCLDEQIEYFTGTVTTDLPKMFTSKTDIMQHLSKSIFSVSIGTNDYINNYFLPEIYTSGRMYTPQHFADLLIHRLKNSIIKLYELGARKFMIINIGRYGCAPAIVLTLKPGAPTSCVEVLNGMILLFNIKLPVMLTALQTTLAGSTFVHGDVYGFPTSQAPCCQLASVEGCVPNSPPCPNRNAAIFFDAIHPTEAAVSAKAIDCFSGSVTCVPINIQQLAQKE